MLAHEVLRPSRLGVSPLVVAVLAWGVVVVVGAWWPGGRQLRPVPAGSGERSDEQSWTVGTIERGWRAHVARLVLGAIALVGFAGGSTQLTNPVTPLVVGAGLPVLVLVAGTGADVPGRWNPFVSPSTRRATAWLDERLVILMAALGSGWLALVPGASDPRRLAWFVLVWTLGSVALDYATGGRWAEQTEPLTRVLGWVTNLRKVSVPDAFAAPAPGVFAVLIGVLLVGAARVTDALPRGLGVGDELLAAAVAGVAALVIARTFEDAERVVPLAMIFVGVVVAVALVGNRLTTSLQLLVVHASDPLQHGWDLFGTAELQVDPAFPDPAWRTAMQVLVVVGAAVTAGRRFPASTGRIARSDALVVALTLLIVTVR